LPAGGGTNYRHIHIYNITISPSWPTTTQDTDEISHLDVAIWNGRNQLSRCEVEHTLSTLQWPATTTASMFFSASTTWSSWHMAVGLVVEPLLPPPPSPCTESQNGAEGSLAQTMVSSKDIFY
jgi:hypothetical protein